MLLTARKARRFFAAVLLPLGLGFTISVAAQAGNSPAPDQAAKPETSLPPVTSDAVSAPMTNTVTANSAPSTNDPFGAAWKLLSATNGAGSNKADHPEDDFELQLQTGRHLRLARLWTEATSVYTNLLDSVAPDPLKRRALVELAEIAEEQNEPARAQQIYAQTLSRWPEDPGVPELLLRQGLAFKQMGLVNLAVTKFYAVMTSALTLKPDSFDNYRQLVLRAQMEIAEAQFEQGQYAEAIDCFGRLLKLEVPSIQRATIAQRYIRCLAALGRKEEAVVQARDFLDKYPDSPDRPEVRFICATALKQLGRGAEAARQVLALLQEERGQSTNASPDLAYWQLRAGNQLANQFYQEGDAMQALDIYLSLSALDHSPEWQLPVWYQIGLVFEHLHQPAKAVEYYNSISQRQIDLSTNAPPSLRTVVEMAKWRLDFLGWQLKRESAALRSPEGPPTAAGKM